MKETRIGIDHREVIANVVEGSLDGRNAHLNASRALEGLKLDVTGRKILNTPYTIW